MNLPSLTFLIASQISTSVTSLWLRGKCMKPRVRERDHKLFIFKWVIFINVIVHAYHFDKIGFGLYAWHQGA